MIQLLRAVDFLHQEMRMIHTDIKDTNILFDLNCHDPGFPQDYWIQQLFDHAPVPTGISYPTFDYVQSKSIFAPVEGPSHVYIQLGDFGSGNAKL
ncbi:MAG: hypothetical protein LQ346_005019 [Caloplaca aetnensis]|nr:MAG: hypothetical protein LQ346_005019 [Caloplaca aetnensis]